MSFHRFLSAAIFFIASATTAVAQEETTDSLLMASDCMSQFFQGIEKFKNPEAVKLTLKNGKIQNIPAFYRANDLGEYADLGLRDLDGDGKKEFIVFNFTGGAHCCDEIFIFKNIGPGKYQYSNHLFGGDVCIGDSNIFRYNFTEHFGYFFTCYACEYKDTAETAPLRVREISLKFSKGKLVVIPGDKELRALILDNLSKMSEEPYQVIKEDDFDDGLRKEFAMNLAVYYYSFGRNLLETKNLFNKYYKFPDAKKVWTAFANDLAALRLQSDF
ncbi:MAG: hypothetical protein IPP73_06195 [Chitinophagaceae bacterium]|nr:hypothetical protein [Chitinophagaceae bacterium]